MGEHHQNHDACLPVTALHNVHIGARIILLIGQGPFLHVQDLKQRSRRASKRIFDVQAIHGIRSCGFPAESDQVNNLSIAVIGGAHVALLWLRWPTEDAEVTDFELHIETIHQVNDWILRVYSHKFSSGKENFLCLTADNTLHVLPNSADTTEVYFPESIQGPRSALYSGDVRSHRPDYILVAAGSVFGEILMWAAVLTEDSSSTWTVKTTHRFEAHNGSVFGIRISQGFTIEGRDAQFVASCSDDRTIQVWDVNDHIKQNTGLLQADESSDTGFGHDSVKSTDRVARVSGHMSRIWDVDFLTVTNGNQRQLLCIISRGEDATCQLWEVELTRIDAGSQMTPYFAHIASDRHHSGKNVLAWTHHAIEDSIILVSGGADGRIVLRPLQLPRRPSEIVLRSSFKDIIVGTRYFIPKDYRISDFGEVTALTTTGDLLRCRDLECEPRWESAAGNKAACTSKICARPEDGIFVSASKDGLQVIIQDRCPLLVSYKPLQSISWVEIVGVNKLAGQDLEVTVVIIFAASSVPVILLRFNTTSPNNVAKVDHLLLPTGFLPTSVCFIAAHDMVFLGSRKGSLAFYSEVVDGLSQRPISIDQIHGDDAVTSLQVISTDQYFVHLLSTGRDGTYAIHAVNTVSKSDAKAPALQTIYQASAPFSMNIEGALLMSNPASNQKELALYGFQSKNFVVWNQSTEVQMLSIDCGGAHRSWDYSFNHALGEHELVWTRASAFNYIKSMGSNVDILKEGGPGREIKAFAFTNDGYEPGSTLIAIGAEDTTVRLFQLATQDDVIRPKPLGVWSSHTTGVQHLTFGLDGRYLFSSGGNGEFFAWRVVNHIPFVGTGLMLLDRMVQNEDDADARIMSFDTMSSTFEGSAGTPGYLLTLAIAYSNGKVRIVDYHPGPDAVPGAGDFVPQLEVVYGTFCLMGVRATRNVNHQTIIVSAGSDGRINPILFDPNAITASDPIKSPTIHQNSILALDCQQVDTSSWLIATGGDDNALGLTLLTATPGQDSYKTFLVPKAHATAVTALHLGGYRSYVKYQSYILVTAGNDQRVKFWGVEVLRKKTANGPGREDIRIVKLHEVWTCIADLSDVAVLDWVEHPEGYLEYEIMVVGIGMEVLSVSLDRTPMLP